MRICSIVTVIPLSRDSSVVIGGVFVVTNQLYCMQRVILERAGGLVWFGLVWFRNDGKRVFPSLSLGTPLGEPLLGSLSNTSSSYRTQVTSFFYRQVNCKCPLE